MKLIKSAVFLNSISDIAAYKDCGLPEIVMVGKSNVGKSSLINMLAKRSSLARVSSTQGKTKTLNFYELNGEFIIVDLPGYGYAKASKLDQQKWKTLIESYFDKSKQIRCGVLILDSRHLPTADDLMMLDFLVAKNINVTIVATKFDKLKKSERMKNIMEIAAALKVGVENVFVASSVDGYGRENLLDRIYQFVGDD